MHTRSCLTEQGAHNFGYRNGKLAAGQRDQRYGEGDDEQQRCKAQRFQIEPLGQRAATQPDDSRGATEIDAGGLEQAHTLLTLRRRASAISTGAPTKAVTMPTCNSPGRMTTRPTMSDDSSRTGERMSVSAAIQR